MPTKFIKAPIMVVLAALVGLTLSVPSWAQARWATSKIDPALAKAAAQARSALTIQMTTSREQKGSPPSQYRQVETESSSHEIRVVDLPSGTVSSIIVRERHGLHMFGSVAWLVRQCAPNSGVRWEDGGLVGGEYLDGPYMTLDLIAGALPALCAVDDHYSTVSYRDVSLGRLSGLSFQVWLARDGRLARVRETFVPRKTLPVVTIDNVFTGWNVPLRVTRSPTREITRSLSTVCPSIRDKHS